MKKLPLIAWLWMTVGWTAQAAAQNAVQAPAFNTWTHGLPMAVCSPLAPGNGCLTTQPLDLRNVQRFRLSVQALNFAPGVPAADVIIRLQDANAVSAPCFGSKCPTLRIPFGSPSLGNCCMPITTSQIINIPKAHRRQNVRLRLTMDGGYINFSGSGVPPVVQFYTD